MIAMSEGTTPFITYINTSTVQVLQSPAPPPDMIKKTKIIVLGHVVARTEVLTHKLERSLRLDVTVSHNNWETVVSPSLI